jgi:hypothetical protein
VPRRLRVGQMAQLSVLFTVASRTSRDSRVRLRLCLMSRSVAGFDGCMRGEIGLIEREA